MGFKSITKTWCQFNKKNKTLKKYLNIRYLFMHIFYHGKILKEFSFEYRKFTLIYKVFIDYIYV